MPQRSFRNAFLRSRGISAHGWGRPFCTLEILHCPHNSTGLFGAHLEILGALCVEFLAVFQLVYCGTNLVHRAEKPLVSVLAFVELLNSVLFEDSMHVVVGKAGAVGSHSRFGVENFVRHGACVQLLFDSGVSVTVGKADFYVAFVGRNAFKLVGVNCGVDLRPLLEKSLSGIVFTA